MKLWINSSSHRTDPSKFEGYLDFFYANPPTKLPYPKTSINTPKLRTIHETCIKNYSQTTSHGPKIFEHLLIKQTTINDA